MRDRFCSCGTRAEIRQLTTGFPKKLLVAISVVVIIAMCLKPAEAASLKRHRPRHNMPKATKDRAPSEEHRRRHHGELRLTKEQDYMTIPMERYESARTKVENKLSYTRDKFNERRIILTEQGGYGLGMPDWVPKNNFVAIHFHKYGGNKTEDMRSKKNFQFLALKLYKSFLEYHELFKRFIKVKATNPDNAIIKYNLDRVKVFNLTTNDIYSAIEDIKDAMNSVKVTRWHKIKSAVNLDLIELEMDGAKYLKFDNILLRSYGNLLENWHLEFNCSKFRKSASKKVTKRRCKIFHNNLKEKRDKRERNRHKQRHSS